MALVTDLIRREQIPHEPGEWFEFRHLSWRKLEEAEKTRSNEMVQTAKLLGAEFMQQAQEQREQIARVIANPLNDYDHAVLLRRGVAAWSYPVPLSDEALDELDEPTKDWAVRRILVIANKLTEDGRSPSDEDVRKND